MIQVQTLTREKRVEFARMKDNTIQKIEILAASRINLLSARLEEYHVATQKYFQSSINALKEVISNVHGVILFCKFTIIKQYFKTYGLKKVLFELN